MKRRGTTMTCWRGGGKWDGFEIFHLAVNDRYYDCCTKRSTCTFRYRHFLRCAFVIIPSSLLVLNCHLASYVCHIMYRQNEETPMICACPLKNPLNCYERTYIYEERGSIIRISMPIEKLDEITINYYNWTCTVSRLFILRFVFAAN